MKKIMVVFGTRPEAVKLAPLINEFKRHPSKFKLIVCVTAQHRQMLDQVLTLFSIIPDYDMNIMTENQDLFDVTIKVLDNLKIILKKEQPDMVVVQGDTTTTFGASLAAFYYKIPVGHVEAGLRTYDKYQPFPEEKNRHMTTVLADYHFAPTDWAKENLIKEGIVSDRIWVTGNTSIDALLEVVKKQYLDNVQKDMVNYFIKEHGLPLHKSSEGNGKKMILVTGHRRENFGKGFNNICLALREISIRNPGVIIVYPVHLNPNVRKPVFDILDSIESSNNKNVYLIPPLEYHHFVYLMDRSYLILTDSGGIQEEAPSLGKPVLVMRNTTERPEGIKVGSTKLVGTDYNKIVTDTQELLDDENVYNRMSSVANPFGDGKAASRIARIIGDVN